MKIKLSLKNIICIALFLVQNVANASSIMFTKANELYRNQQYAAAANMYMQLINDGYISGNIYYNAGNAFYKNNNIGWSIWCFEKALQQQPNNILTKENLALANSKIKPAIFKTKDIFFVRWFNKCIHFHTLNTWSVLSLLFFLGYVFLYFLKKEKTCRQYLFQLEK